jgi:cyclopropane fatty-acyl-phospholipid synthase-like methyltransferase
MDGVEELTAATSGVSAPSPYDEAELYDALFHDLDMDRAFWRDRALEAAGPVLEVACGTGRVTCVMAAALADVDGFDLHPAMLERLRARAAAEGLRIGISLADMRDFRMPRRYALIAIPFNAFLHNLTQADQIATLVRCREHLLPGGRLILHVSCFGAAVLATSGGEPVLEHETHHPRTGHALRIYDGRTMDTIEQIQHSRNEVHELDERGEVIAIHRSETRVRWIHKPELELLLAAAGFTRWRIDGGFDGKPLESEEDQMVIFAWPGEKP